MPHDIPHRHKRQYQPDITTFFPLRPRSLNTQPRQPSQPTLPDAVQANLISVGMRVRKAVPEGYAHLRASKHVACPDARQVPSLRGQRGGVGFHRRELVPFCGLHRIGGLEGGSFGEGGEEGVDDFDGFPSSQESGISDVSTDSTTNVNQLKRGFDEEDGTEDFDCSFRFDGDGTSPVFEFGLSRARAAERRMAVPVSRRKRQEEGMRTTRVDEFDFGEAEFLRFGGDMDVDF